MIVRNICLALAVFIASGGASSAETSAIDLSRYLPIDLRGTQAFFNSNHRYDGSHYLIVAPMELLSKDDEIPGHRYEVTGEDSATAFPAGVIGGNPMSPYHLRFAQQMWVELDKLPKDQLAELVEQCPPITRCTARWYVTVIGTRRWSAPNEIGRAHV